MGARRLPRVFEMPLLAILKSSSVSRTFSMDSFRLRIQTLHLFFVSLQRAAIRVLWIIFSATLVWKDRGLTSPYSVQPSMDSVGMQILPEQHELD